MEAIGLFMSYTMAGVVTQIVKVGPHLPALRLSLIVNDR